MVAGSLAAGAVTALVLTLVVFPGATEAVITGSMLLGFGFGWALMAVLSDRMTSQPQRWAAVPAVAMSATGLALLTLSPGDAALTAVGWVWPPAMVALVVWTFVQVRRDLRGRGRWLVTPVLVVLAAASIGATIENVVAGPRPERLPRPGPDLRGGRPPAAPRLPRPGRPDRGALQRPRRVLRLLGQDHRRGRHHDPGLCLRPRRSGVERGRRALPRTA